MKLNTRTRKKFRVKGKLKKVAKVERLRLSIFRSSKNIFDFNSIFNFITLR